MDKAPCAGTEIHLYRGADSTSYQCENDLVLTYFKGHEEAKKRLRKDHPDEFNRIKRILDLRKRHMRKDVPIKYIFCLSCCYGTAVFTRFAKMVHHHKITSGIQMVLLCPLYQFLLLIPRGVMARVTVKTAKDCVQDIITKFTTCGNMFPRVRNFNWNHHPKSS